MVTQTAAGASTGTDGFTEAARGKKAFGIFGRREPNQKKMVPSDPLGSSLASRHARLELGCQAPEFCSLCSPALPFGSTGSTRKKLFTAFPDTSQSLGTAFRSPATISFFRTTSRRGQCSRPVPSTASPVISRARSAWNFSPRFRIASSGEDQHSVPVARFLPDEPCRFPNHHSPAGLLHPSRITAPNPVPDTVAYRDVAPDFPSLPESGSFALTRLQINVPGSLRFTRFTAL